jgi:hypothetical protein
MAYDYKSPKWQKKRLRRAVWSRARAAGASGNGG